MKLLDKIILMVVFITGLLSCSTGSIRTADPDFVPKNIKNSFEGKNKPVVFLDEGHNNSLTKNGRYKPFSQILSSDGYTVVASKEKFTLAYLKQADILVIANALDKTRSDWLPPFGDAFDSEEIQAVKQWVSQGGSLLLIADHFPFPKIIDKLAVAFGFTFNHGHVGKGMFRMDNKTLRDHEITKGSFNTERIVQVKTFGGSAFQIPDEAKSLLVLGKAATASMPDIPFQINAETPKVTMAGWSQGAVVEVGGGRVAVFSEALMFSSQLHVPTGKKFGILSAGAEQNEQFLLNVMHWLSHII